MTTLSAIGVITTGSDGGESFNFSFDLATGSGNFTISSGPLNGNTYSDFTVSTRTASNLDNPDYVASANYPATPNSKSMSIYISVNPGLPGRGTICCRLLDNAGNVYAYLLAPGAINFSIG